jgi:hypothetical protein
LLHVVAFENWQFAPTHGALQLHVPVELQIPLPLHVEVALQNVQVGKLKYPVAQV